MKKTIIATLVSVGLAAPSLLAVHPAVEEIKKQYAPDARQTVLEAEVVKLAGGGVKVVGVTSEQRVHDALVSRLGRDGVAVTDSLAVYPDTAMALVSIPVASLRTRGAHAGEMATQAVMGTPVRMLAKAGEWWRVQTPDGYIAYVPESSITQLSREAMARWRVSDSRHIVNSLWQIRVYATPEAAGPRDVVTDLVLGSIVEVEPGTEPQAGRRLITLPDGRRGWVDASALTPVAEWAAQTFDADKILDTAYSLEGSPYLWGGTSAKSVDCSGLVKVSYFNNGLILRRDASQQALTGMQLDVSRPDYEAGDLLFFGNANTGRITHVAIYDSADRYVHSSGRVKRNSLDRNDPTYLYSPLKAVRIHGSEGGEGIVRAADHPWYF